MNHEGPHEGPSFPLHEEVRSDDLESIVNDHPIPSELGEAERLALRRELDRVRRFDRVTEEHKLRAAISQLDVSSKESERKAE